MSNVDRTDLTSMWRCGWFRLPDGLFSALATEGLLIFDTPFADLRGYIAPEFPPGRKW